MKTYLVGGAVRDTLLNYPVKERDWVVVGASVEYMHRCGFKQVGKDFPVFLHPKTGEEYALARQERKTGNGYAGFSFTANPQVRLEDDLARRDLTINAIAQDEDGSLIDPFNGQADLKSKLLRHVSPAFSEDPVRVLRVARFAARYHHLGFTLAEKTRALMYQMVKNNEVSHLVPERLWQEWQKSLEERDPQIFISTLRSCGALAVILPELDCLFGVPNSPGSHPEIDSGIHTLLTLQAAAALSCDPCIRFAALLHDLGKATTPICEWPKHRNHEEKGVPLVKQLCERLRVPREYTTLALLSCRFHLKIHQLAHLNAEQIMDVLDKTDAFRRPQLFQQLLVVCTADAQGCGSRVAYPQAKLWQSLLHDMQSINVEKIIKSGHSGLAIKQQLRKLRVELIQSLQQSEKKNEK